MSEEIKDIILDVKDSLNGTPKNMYKYNKITLNLNEFEEILNYIEQLENIKKEIKEYIEKNVVCFKNGDMLVELNVDDLLNILNKGEKK